LDVRNLKRYDIILRPVGLKTTLHQEITGKRKKEKKKKKEEKERINKESMGTRQI
jgi:hypothetical protein